MALVKWTMRISWWLSNVYVYNRELLIMPAEASYPYLNYRLTLLITLVQN